jgi:hypothetical protein
MTWMLSKKPGIKSEQYFRRQDPKAVRKWLEHLVQLLGARVLVNKDLATYQPGAEKLGLEHQVC